MPIYEHARARTGQYAQALPCAAGKVVSRRRYWTVRIVKTLAILLVAWLLLAYVVLPLIWQHYEHNPALADVPKTTSTAQGIPGDPLNVGLVGGEAEVDPRNARRGLEPGRPDHAQELHSYRRQRGLQAARSGLRRSVGSFFSAAARIWRSKSRSAAVPATGITSGSGNGTKAAMRGGRSGLDRRLTT